MADNVEPTETDTEVEVEAHGVSTSEIVDPGTESICWVFDKSGN